MSTRREFLKKSALLGGAAAVYPVSSWASTAEEASAHARTASANTYTIDMRTAMNIPEITPREITIPDTAGFKVLKGDFHIHTLFSDGSVMPTDRVVEAVQNGLDVIAMTDHIEYRPNFSKTGKWKLIDEQANDYNLPYKIAKPEADKRNLLLIPGTEITKSFMPPGHFNALFAKDVNEIAAVQDDWKKMLRVAADQGCFLLWNHPGWEAPKSGGIEPNATLQFTKIYEELQKEGLMHGIEVFNCVEQYPVVSDWCNERDLAIFANSDIHPSELNMYGLKNPARPITLVLAKERTIESVREAMFARRTIAWAANILWGRKQWMAELFKASVEIKTITPGRMELTNKSSLPMIVSMGGVIFELPQNRKQQVYRAENVNKVTVNNWMIGMNKPLEVEI